MNSPRKILEKGSSVIKFLWVNVIIKKKYDTRGVNIEEEKEIKEDKEEEIEEKNNIRKIIKLKLIENLTENKEEDLQGLLIIFLKNLKFMINSNEYFNVLLHVFEVKIYNFNKRSIKIKKKKKRIQKL
jgi:hypothetical protein